MPLDKTVVKSWFEFKDKPTAAQFASWIDACVFSGDAIPSVDISGIAVAALAGVTKEYAIPTGFAVHTIYITPQANDTVSITAGPLPAVAYAVDIDLLTGEPQGVSINVTGGKSIFFVGHNSNLTIKIFLHKL